MIDGVGGSQWWIDFAKIRNPYPACQGFHEVFSKFLQVFLRRRKRLPRNAFTLGARGGGSRSVSQSVSCLKSGTRGDNKKLSSNNYIYKLLLLKHSLPYQQTVLFNWPTDRLTDWRAMGYTKCLKYVAKHINFVCCFQEKLYICTTHRQIKAQN